MKKKILFSYPKITILSSPETEAICQRIRNGDKKAIEAFKTYFGMVMFSVWSKNDMKKNSDLY